MKTYNWDRGFESFLDRKESGNVYFDVVVGSGNPQRLYPETDKELKECRERVTFSNLNPTLGSLWPEGTRQ